MILKGGHFFFLACAAVHRLFFSPTLIWGRGEGGTVENLQ